ncbi:MAG: SAM-dependent methyltransferase [Tabrizicola sp.]|uniref:SAM-dependent methyltransferase n=1 Tax=Tabrizicola sp. TaxID=2005166 RepID=UPI002736A12A|nr:SAM-dependent methyltransferase [Tabrizicola sp.]MDP3261596.1 SAM-dependent methyltransferase [Tabrizicola sp.]MDP3648334.1 SAM-dependent methyltransferase [Paracoccaceae bacterium]
MKEPPKLTDRVALSRNRQRALQSGAHQGAGFLHAAMIADVQERLNEVNRTFTDPVIVTDFPHFWQKALPQATIVPDEDVLSLDRSRHDLVIHAMSLHWANDPLGQLVQCRLALRPDGLFIAQFLGGRTLQQLRACLAHAEASITGGVSPRVLPMAEIRDLGDLLHRAGFAMPVADSTLQTVLYGSPYALLGDLRAMGETNALAGRLRHPTRRSIVTEAMALYASTYGDADGRVPASFEIISLTGWAPDESQPKALRPGSAQQRLADALNAQERRLPDEG